MVGKYLTVHSETDMPKGVIAEWTDTVNRRTKEMASMAVSAVEHSSENETDNADEVSALLRNRLTTCGQAILLARFASLTTMEKMGSTETLEMLKNVTDEMCADSYPEANNPCHVYSGFLGARKRSVEDLKEALTMLECELRLARFNSLQQANGKREVSTDV